MRELTPEREQELARRVGVLSGLAEVHADIANGIGYACVGVVASPIGRSARAVGWSYGATCMPTIRAWGPS